MKVDNPTYVSEANPEVDIPAVDNPTKSSDANPAVANPTAVVVEYVEVSTDPSAFKNCDDVPPDFTNDAAVTIPVNAEFPLVSAILLPATSMVFVVASIVIPVPI